MSRNVYSTRFIGYTAASPITQYEVAEGYVAVIRQVSISCSVSDVTYQLYTQDDEDAYGIVVVSGNFDAIVGTQSQEGRWWVPEGGIITLEASSYGGGFNAYVGGYLLTLP